MLRRPARLPLLLRAAGPRDVGAALGAARHPARGPPGVPIEACEPLAGEVESRAARAIAGDAKPVCFRVPAVKFRFAEEAYDPLPVAAE